MSSDIGRILAAASYAADRHREQRRKDAAASPYVKHPLEVASLLANEGGVVDGDLLIAALLHDVVEDTSTTLAELTDQFGEAISCLVEEVTDDKSLPKDRRKELQIEKAPQKSARAKQLKIADKTCNIRDIDADSPRDWDRERKLRYLVWAEKVVAGCRGVNDRLDQQFDHALREAQQRLGETPPTAQ